MGFREIRQPVGIPTRLVVNECAMKLDGGTVCVVAVDEHGCQHSIQLVTPLPSTYASGRLYLNSELVPIRSELEARILKLLAEAKITADDQPPSVSTGQIYTASSDIAGFFERSPAENCRATIRKIIESVQSEKYLALTTLEERAVARDFDNEASRDVWEPKSGKKKRRPGRRGGE